MKNMNLNDLGLAYVFGAHLYEKVDEAFPKIETDAFSGRLYADNKIKCKKRAKELEVSGVEIKPGNKAYLFDLSFDEELQKRRITEENRKRKDAFADYVRRACNVSDITNVGGYEVAKYLDFLCDSFCIKAEGHDAGHPIEVAALGMTYIQKLKENKNVFMKRANSLGDEFEKKRAARILEGLISVPEETVVDAGILHEIGRTVVPIETCGNHNNSPLSHSIEGQKIWKGGLENYYKKEGLIDGSACAQIEDTVLNHSLMMPYIFQSSKHPSTMLIKEADRLTRSGWNGLGSSVDFAIKASGLENAGVEIPHNLETHRERMDNYTKYAFITKRESDVLDTIEVKNFEKFIKNKFAGNSDFRDVLKAIEAGDIRIS